MSVYNLSMIEETTAGDKEFMALLARTFVEEVPNDVHAMNEAVENENGPLAYQIVHKMKPNLQMLGLRLENHINALQTWSDSTQDIDVAQQHIDKIEAVLTTTFEELKRDFNI